MTGVHTKGRGKNKVRLYYYWQNRKFKDISSPWVFVYTNGADKPLFFCVPKEDMKMLMKEALESLKVVKIWRLTVGRKEGTPMIRIELNFDDAEKHYSENEEDLKWFKLYEETLGHKQPLPLASSYIDNWNDLFN